MESRTLGNRGGQAMTAGVCNRNFTSIYVQCGGNTLNLQLDTVAVEALPDGRLSFQEPYFFSIGKQQIEATLTFVSMDGTPITDIAKDGPIFKLPTQAEAPFLVITNPTNDIPDQVIPLVGSKEPISKVVDACSG